MRQIRAEMAATVWTVVAAVGDVVGPDDVLLVLESMKMEIPVVAEVAGTVSSLPVGEGGLVQEGDVLAVIGKGYSPPGLAPKRTP